jgi:hypothetical protein
MTLSIMTLSIITLSMKYENAKLSIMTFPSLSECHHADLFMLSIAVRPIMLSVIMLIVVILSVLVPKSLFKSCNPSTLHTVFYLRA